MPNAPLSPAEAAQIRRDMAMFYTKTVTVEPRTGLNEYAEGIYGTAVTYAQVRIQGKVQQLRTNTGEEVTSTQVLHFLGTAAVAPDDRVTLPDGAVRFVLAVDPVEIGDETMATVAFL